MGRRPWDARTIQILTQSGDGFAGIGHYQRKKVRKFGFWQDSTAIVGPKLSRMSHAAANAGS